MTYTIRDFLPSDAASVNEVAVTAFSQFRGEYRDGDAFLAGLRKMSNLSETAELVVAERKGQVVGAVVYVGPKKEKAAYFGKDCPAIRMLVVAPHARGQGMGRALTQACIDRAIRDETRLIKLHTSPIMKVALPLYLRMGFSKECDLEPLRGVPYALYVKRW